MPRVEAVTVGESTIKDAHNLDDGKERHQIRGESLLNQARWLNGFERLVKAGELNLFRLPEDAANSQVGREVNIRKRGPRAYWAYVMSRGEPEQRVSVDLDDVRKPAKGSYKVIYQGPADTIKYRHPEENKLQVGGSALIHFAVLERKGKQIALHDPRV